jgi:hypothetical protein
MRVVRKMIIRARRVCSGRETRAALGLPKQDDDDVDGDNASVLQKQPTGEDIFQALFGCSSFGARRWDCFLCVLRWRVFSLKFHTRRVR